MLDQSIAVVDKQVITLRDVQARIFAENTLSSNEKSPEEFLADHHSLDKIQATREALVEEMIIDSYFQTGQLKKIELTSKHEQLNNAQKKELSLLNLSENAVLKMLNLKYQKNLFIDSFISLRVNIRPGELETFYESKKNTDYASKPLGLIRKRVELDLKSSRLQDEYKKWRDSQIVRSNVIFLPLPDRV